MSEGISESLGRQTSRHCITAKHSSGEVRRSLANRGSQFQQRDDEGGLSIAGLSFVACDPLKRSESGEARRSLARKSESFPPDEGAWRWLDFVAEWGPVLEA